jgi:hypothetical protein
VLVWVAPSLTMNPALDPAIVSQADEADPLSAAAEYGAQFRSDVDAFVTREVLDRCIVPGRQGLPPLPELATPRSSIRAAARRTR